MPSKFYEFVGRLGLRSDVLRRTIGTTLPDKLLGKLYFH